MKILLSNDDGYRAEGLRCLAEHLRDLAEIVIVAPERNCSGASNSLTLEQPLRLTEVGPGSYFVNGTPTDCVHLALTGLLDEEPDMVISGINDGANLGDDVLYSGTVAAAMEGRFLGLPTIAISMVCREDRRFETAGRVARELVSRVLEHSLPPTSILNVNVPDVPWEALGGFESTRLGHRHKAEPVVRGTDPRGRPLFWVGFAGAGQDAGPGTDFHAIESGRVSVTPLKVDLTKHEDIERIETWLGTPILD
ncbi:MAG: 5'/3'-nucleotidase SurE [Gammaproteobacteria bacterium]